MPLVIDKDSHLDHGLSSDHVEYIKRRFEEKSAFFIETFEMPPMLASLQSGIYGPSAGDPPVGDAECLVAIRMGRPWPSRLIEKPARPTRLLTVVAGPGDDESQPCVLYTAYGGPKAPKEPGDFSLGLFCQEHSQLWQALINRVYQLHTGAWDKIKHREIMAGQLDAGLHCEACQKGREELVLSLAFWRQHAISMHDCEIVKNSTSVEVRDWRSKAGLFLSKRFPGARLEFTCDRCSDNDTCRYSYDPACVGTRCLRKILASEDR